MAWTDFYLNQNAGASDLNAGSTTSDVGGGSDAAIYTSVAGNFDGTSVFTPTDGSTPASTVSVGMYVALYNTGDTVCRAVAQVTAVGAGVNGTITVSTTIKYGTFPTSNSGSRALKCGGAWTSFATWTSPGIFNTSATVPQSTRVNVKAATYANTTTQRQINTAGSATLGFWWRGYKTTPGDQDLNFNPVVGTDVPSITFTTSNMVINGSHIAFSSLGITTASTFSMTVNSFATDALWYGCTITNTGANAVSVALTMSAASTSAVGCYLGATTTAAEVLSMAGNGNRALGCVINGGIIGILAAGSMVAVRNVFYGQAGDSIKAAGAPTTIVGNSIYAPLGNGVNVTSTSANGFLIANNYFSTVNQASKAAIMNSSGTNIDATILTCVANAYYNCTANTSGITEGFTIFDNGTLASEAFLAPTASPPNFAVGPVAWNLAFPGAFEGTSTYRGYLAVGAVQPNVVPVINQLVNRYYVNEGDR
jgi:hypothetical protein